MNYLNYRRRGMIAAGLLLLASMGMEAFAQNSPQLNLRVLTARPVQQVGVEPGTNRPGLDYKSFELSDARPEVCQRACADDPNCKAYTYVKPGAQGSQARCWLKSEVPAASRDDCCVSGVKTTSPSLAEPIAITSNQPSPQVRNRVEGVKSGATDPTVLANGECGLTFPCSGSVSSPRPAFSVTNTLGVGIQGRTGSTKFNVAGVLGEATANTGTVVGVYGAARNDPNGTGVAGFGSATGGYFEAIGSSGKRVGVYGVGGSTGVTGQGDTGVYGESNGNAGVRGLNTGGGAGVVGVSFNAKGTGGSFSNTKGGTALEVIGTASMRDVEVSVLKINGGSDLAERFEVIDEARPGMVVAIDPDHPGMLRVAKGAYNRSVAGILSGAKDLGAGMVLADLPGAKNSMPVALSGRVWVYSDATSQAIEPGDLLTTADRPGHAMAVRDHTRAHGAIIGKAMSRLKHGTGLVLVLVALQ